MSAESGEDRLIRWLDRRIRRRGRSLLGDDAAILPEAEAWAVTTDSQIEGVHFLPELDPADVARRLLAVNLSDLAAMGARPAYAFLALAAPAGFDHRRFLAAFLRACERTETELAGGDLAAHDRLTVTLTLLGRRPSGKRWLLRGGARPGERLWLGGTLGEAAAGCHLLRKGSRVEGRKTHLPASLDLSRAIVPAARRAVRRHLLPRPQLALGAWLGTQEAGAAIDVSDGFARDLHRLCEASGTGAEIELDRLPLARGFRRLTRELELDWQELALTGGEDYVLLFTLPAGQVPPPELEGFEIGSISERQSIRMRREGRTIRLDPRGWDHLDRESGEGSGD